MFAAALWDGQPERIEVWVEKDALVDVVGRAAGPLRVPYFSCRGYTSVSEVSGSGRADRGQAVAPGRGAGDDPAPRGP